MPEPFGEGPQEQMTPERRQSIEKEAEVAVAAMIANSKPEETAEVIKNLKSVAKEGLKDFVRMPNHPDAIRYGAQLNYLNSLGQSRE